MPEVRLIDANALTDELQRYLEKAFMDQSWEIAGCIEAFIRIIDEHPTIDAEPVRHGHWHYDLPNAIFTCSECYMMYRDNPKYCPRCGARMDGGADDEKA